MTPALILIALKSALVAAATLALLRLAARRSAAERSAIAHLGICALLALPLAHAFLPSLSVLVPGQLAVEVLQTPAPIPVMPPVSQLETVPVPAAGGSVAPATGTIILCAYLAPAVSLLLLMCAALLQLFRLRANARPVTDAAWRGAFARAQVRMGFTKDAALLIGGTISSPISWGLARPAILLNEEILAAPARAEAIIAHELAHVIQYDWARLILARVATAVFWFNPLAWMLEREAHHLREEAADDAVLAAGITGPDYATLLIDVARCEARGALSAVHGVAPRRSSLHRRIMRVLDDGAVRAVPRGNQLAALTAAMLAVAVPLAALRFAPAVVPVRGMPHGAGSAVVAAASSLIPAHTAEAAAPARPQSTPVLTTTPPAIERSTGQPVAPPAKRPVTAAVASRSAPSAAPAPPAQSAAQPVTGALQQQAGLDLYPQALRGTLDAECFSSGGTPGQSPNLFRTADFNGDGIPDIVFDRMNYECRGATVGPGRYGTTLTIFIGGPSHSVAEVYTGSFYGSWVEYGRDGKPSLIVADAANCGTPDAEGDSNSGWESCGHRVVLNPPAQGSGSAAEPVSDKAEDR